MRNYYICFFLFFTLIISLNIHAQPYGVPVKKPEAILKDVTAFLNYWHTTLALSEDFIAMDTSGKTISKGEFLKRVSTSEYLPVRLTSQSHARYKLYRITDSVNHVIPLLLNNIGNEELNNYQWEGKPLPVINLKDLNENFYNQQTIKGKILVLNFWFIHCLSCVQEIPELNKLVDKYKNRKDISFLAVALDKEENLKAFKKKTPFNYKIISDTAQYLYKTLGLYGYPAQVLINKDGKIVKIFSNFYSYERLVPALKKEASK